MEKFKEKQQKLKRPALKRSCLAEPARAHRERQELRPGRGNMVHHHACSRPSGFFSLLLPRLDGHGILHLLSQTGKQVMLHVQCVMVLGFKAFRRFLYLSQSR